MIRLIYSIIVMVFLLEFASHVLLGRDSWGGSERSELPSEVRNQSGGYRTFIYTNSGYQGGK